MLVSIKFLYSIYMDKELKNKPTGCFPPILFCTGNDDNQKHIVNKERSFSAEIKQNVVSIAQIMKNTKVEPFIEL